jgi:3-hydroxyacyl-CoA dehydrogenase
MTALVRSNVVENIAFIEIDNPPVNALSPGVAEGVLQEVAKANSSPDVDAIVLIGAGKTFIAGADIRQFGTDRVQLPVGSRVADTIDLAPKPILAAINGYALGGGMEYALACHYRIAVRSAKIGLPEVLIGVIPGGGGTQRLPRLIGVEAALEIIATGKHLPAQEAFELGILDAVIDEPADLHLAALQYAKRISSIRPLPRIRDREVPLSGTAARAEFFTMQRERLSRRMRNQPAPLAALEAIETACSMPFAEGIRTEHELFQKLETSAEAAALRYGFFAERRARTLPGIHMHEARSHRSVAVVGAGTMGTGIAMCVANSGRPVLLLDKDEPTLKAAMARIAGNYSISASRGSIPGNEVSKRTRLIRATTDYDEISDCDVIIEAVFEDIAVKDTVLRRVSSVAGKHTTILTNTSAISVDRLSQSVKNRTSFAGAHFFSPANVMKLLEVVIAKETSSETLGTIAEFGKDIGKVCVFVKDCDGFLTSRSRAPFLTEMVILLEEGASPEQIDRVMVQFGYPMGPFAAGDLAGLDIGYAWRKRRAAADPNYRTLPIADRIVEIGRLGQKTSAGWYRYEQASRTPVVDPIVTQLIEAVSKELGIERRHLTDEEILARMLYGSVNESCRIVEEGIVARASDVDVAWLNGFAFPRYRGGLMYWADTIGASRIHDQICQWHEKLGDRWKPAPLLASVAKSGGALRELVTAEASV